jgi:hypothetical protein
MRRLSAPVIVGVSFALASTFGHASSVRQEVSSASRLVDRTFACSVRLSAPTLPDPTRVRSIGVRFAPNTGRWPGSVSITDQNARPESGLVAVFRRAVPGRATGGVWVSRSRCRWLRNDEIPLSSAGIAGPPSRYDAGFECTVAGRILVRMRGTMRGRVNWITRSNAYEVRGSVLNAEVAARTQAGRRPLAFAVVTNGAKSRLHVAPRCTPD